MCIGGLAKLNKTRVGQNSPALRNGSGGKKVRAGDSWLYAVSSGPASGLGYWQVGPAQPK